MPIKVIIFPIKKIDGLVYLTARNCTDHSATILLYLLSVRERTNHGEKETYPPVNKFHFRNYLPGFVSYFVNGELNMEQVLTEQKLQKMNTKPSPDGRTTALVPRITMKSLTIVAVYCPACFYLQP
jgi:hypothetical protein